MEALQLEKRRYSREEYFALLKESVYKLEYLDGEIRMMSGGSIAHNDIIDNVFGNLWSKRNSCKVKNSENAVFIETLNSYFFPDLTVTCNKPTYEEGGIAKLTNPELIIEVLSESTADYDRTDKFTAYRQLESFKEYILIDSRRMRVDTFYRNTNQYWRIGSYYEPEHEVEVRTLGLQLPLSIIYDDVVFPVKD
ncbi:Uma2 family endonuclease [Neolewinella aurantiaca]|uniref:Uma2 family endonuclease n=1 Tax=Neolewinella aurantiaca TaxID=2602767 RepID=A0A5C7FME6_9BACT|nr:Uma2 family endonuclease [Neolewinella aurantiaca]TXF91240.1 Uma2 family endonuclease [Neolewinella aurantiaca]